jgi:hypothetical protein
VHSIPTTFLFVALLVKAIAIKEGKARYVLTFMTVVQQTLMKGQKTI